MPHVVICEGSHLAVTTNLHSALRRLRLKDRSRALWADAICIDQSNIGERNQQVQIMRDVYRQSKEVLIWLGDEEPTDGLAFKLVLDINEYSAGRSEGSSSSKMKDEPYLILSWLKDRKGAALAQLLQRPWFCRVWVTQEAVSAAQATLICGRHQMPFDDLITALSHLARHPMETAFNPELYGGANNDGYVLLMEMGLQRLYLRDGYVPEMNYLLTRTRRCGATDPRDKVFAIIGISKDAEDSRLKPDYGLSLAEVYKNLAMQQLSGPDSLDLLSLVGDDVQNAPPVAMPSWVPNWTHQLGNGIPLARDAHFRAGKAYIPKVRFAGLENSMLIVRGKIISSLSQIEKIGDAIKGTAAVGARYTTTQFESAYKKADFIIRCRALASKANPYVTGEPFSRVLWRVMICDLDYERNKAPEYYRDYFQAACELTDAYYHSWTHPGSNEPDLPFLIPRTPKMTVFDKTFDVNALGRNFCLTQDGYLGWVPLTAKRDDVVCVLEGGKVPFVLRRDGDEYFEVIGECYIHGIMHGEAMDMEQFPLQDITLR